MASYINIILSTLLLSINFGLYAQNMLTGHVYELSSGSPVPFANVIIKGTTIGSSTDESGYFEINMPSSSDSMLVSAISFEALTVPIKNGPMSVFLKESTYELEEVQIRPGENPAHPIIKRAIENKPNNAPSAAPSWKSEVYNKIRIDLKNFNKAPSRKGVMSQFNYVFEHVDTLKDKNATVLPVFMSETVSDIVNNKEQNEAMEYIKASKTSGTKTDMIAQFTGQFYQSFDLYDNYIVVNNVSLISPLNNQGFLFYKYYLFDSTEINGHKIYQINCIPKFKQEPSFEGNIWITQDGYAVVKAELAIGKKANINFLNSLEIRKSYHLIDNTWLPQKEEIILDLTVSKSYKKSLGFIGHKTTFYQNIELNPELAPIEEGSRVLMDKDASNKDSNYWEDKRPEVLSKKEDGVYQMVDSLQNIPAYKITYNILEFFFYGYIDMGKFEFGPYYYTYSNNEIEGHRVRISARTKAGFSKTVRFDGYLAHGFKDREFKYGLGMNYYFKKNPDEILRIYSEHDYQLLGRSSTSLSEDNLFSSLFNLNPRNELNIVDNIEVSYIKEWFIGLSNTLTVRSRRIFESEFVPFTHPIRDRNSINTFDVTLSTRIAIGEEQVHGDFNSKSLGTKNPIVEMDITKSIPNVMPNDYDYTRFKVSVTDKIFTNPLGYSRVRISAEKIFGTLPFPLLKLHEGNETYSFDKGAFNLLNNYEFVSDQYMSLYYEHHFMGFFLNKIPGINLLKFRELVSLRAVAGSVSNSQSILEFPMGLRGLGQQPYVEAGIGIENILKVIRIDLLRRLTYYSQPMAQKYGIRLGFQFNF